MAAMAHREEAAPFEILEHTADIGLLARGRTLEEAFENAAWGMVEILGAGAGRDAPGDAVSMDVGGADREALLVSWLDEVLFSLEHSGRRVARVSVREVDDHGARGELLLVEGEPPDGTELKAATYHQLAIRETPDGYEATVYFDV
jgi:SHS2 domain-containing protein